MIANLKFQGFSIPLDGSATSLGMGSAAGDSRALTIFIAHPSQFLTDHRSHGDGLAAYDLIRRLAERGHELHVAVGEMDLRGQLPANVEFYPIKTRAEPLTMLWRLEYTTKVRELLGRLSKKKRIDVIHQLNPVVTGLSLFLGKTGCPLVLGPYVPYWSRRAEGPDRRPHLTERVGDGFRDYVLTKILHRQQQLAAALLISTPAAMAKICSEPKILAKTHELPYGVDVRLFSPRDDRPNDTRSPNILFIANLQRRKGIYTLLDAFEILAAKHPTCHLTIAGGGEEEAEIKRLIATKMLGLRVTMTGRVDRQDVPAALRDCTVYCLPSYGEPFGMSALEAMACGVPVVATDVGGLSYLITEDGGRKVPPGDAPALAGALLEIVNSPALQLQMGAFNRARVLRAYGKDQIVGRLEEIYRKVIGERNNSDHHGLNGSASGRRSTFSKDGFS